MTSKLEELAKWLDGALVFDTNEEQEDFLIAAAQTIRDAMAREAALKAKLEIALDTLVTEGVCNGVDCMACQDARALTEGA